MIDRLAAWVFDCRLHHGLARWFVLLAVPIAGVLAVAAWVVGR